MGATTDARVDEWRRYVQRRAAIAASDVDEMEAHLRDQVDDLVAVGLDEDEAFLVAVKRLGNVDALSQEFAREHADRLWKQHVASSPADGERAPEFGVVLLLGVLAALAVRVGIAVLSDQTVVGNAPLLVLPFLGGYFAWKRRVSVTVALTGLVAVAALAVVLNAYPFDGFKGTHVLALVHAPVLLWCLVGVAYGGGRWRSRRRRMDFVRFTGEWVIYYALLALGGMALTGLTAAAFVALGLEPDAALAEWIVPMGAAGAVLVAAWLVEAKQSIIENMAPVLTRVFTPLTVVLLVALFVGLVGGGDLSAVDRQLLMVMDLVLVLVVGLVLYAVSARDPLAPPGWFDRLQLLLVVCALAVDAVVLVAMVVRIADAGLTANKVAALGLNLVLLVNLLRSLQLSTAFVRGRRPFDALERWQTGYLPVYAAWAAVVVIALPPLFHWA
ncbi:permease prefix domain 1-containing protein [Nocardioides sp. DS6]|uniref:Permease prefix domain 1-containing protein n=1 Tax=Nocardioides eburneus TaxID=3231482 RepID=A0ABV3SZE5_9ACTN